MPNAANQVYIGSCTGWGIGCQSSDVDDIQRNEDKNNSFVAHSSQPIDRVILVIRS